MENNVMSHNGKSLTNGACTNGHGTNGHVKPVVKPTLRLITYMCPSIPMELFQVYQQCLEESLGCEVMLCVESRWSAPPGDRVNPFDNDFIDIGFMCSTGYVTMSVHEKKSPYIEILPLAPLFDHPLANDKPVYFSEVIIRKDCESRFKTLEDLRGFKFAMNDAYSMSGCYSMRSELKKMGVDVSFFGSIVQSGSHKESIKQILNGSADTAAIDSNVWRFCVTENPELKEKLTVLTSLGPYPIYPLFVNSRLSGEVKESITTALLKAHQSPLYREKFLKFGLKGFAHIDESHFDATRDIMENVQNQNLKPRYY